MTCTQQIKSSFSSTSNICRITVASRRARCDFAWEGSARRAGICQSCTARKFRLTAVGGQSQRKVSCFWWEFFFFLSCEDTDWKSVWRLAGVPAVCSACWVVCVSNDEFRTRDVSISISTSLQIDIFFFAPPYFNVFQEAHLVSFILNTNLKQNPSTKFCILHMRKRFMVRKMTLIRILPPTLIIVFLGNTKLPK